jgi:hypothetical protein
MTNFNNDSYLQQGTRVKLKIIEEGSYLNGLTGTICGISADFNPLFTTYIIEMDKNDVIPNDIYPFTSIIMNSTLLEKI